MSGYCYLCLACELLLAINYIRRIFANAFLSVLKNMQLVTTGMGTQTCTLGRLFGTRNE